ncbi:MAG TPA: cupin domain-containing protein [Rhizomicrobium sp.]|nr:cupin domain-containing protein [Rhizomicrobium sp.]
MLKMPAFDPAEVKESNATTYPAPYHTDNLKRFNRRIGDHARLTHYGVVLTRIVPGGQSSHRHAHSTQDEFVYVLEGQPTLETDQGAQQLKPGTCAGFPAGTGDAHRFANRTERDVLLLVVGDRSPNDDVRYPDVDMHLACQPDGNRRFFHKDGTPY